jgi:hypothetical protein
MTDKVERLLCGYLLRVYKIYFGQEWFAIDNTKISFYIAPDGKRALNSRVKNKQTL